MQMGRHFFLLPPIYTWAVVCFFDHILNLGNVYDFLELLYFYV